MSITEKRLEELGIKLPMEQVRGTLPLRQVGNLSSCQVTVVELQKAG